VRSALCYFAAFACVREDEEKGPPARSRLPYVLCERTNTKLHGYLCPCSFPLFLHPLLLFLPYLPPNFLLSISSVTPFRDFQARQARQGGVGGNEMKITVRNLRIREDTPKYLRNLALDRYTAGTYSFLRSSFFISSLCVSVA
jgi:Pre-mRNA splicing Prp18-interacting factor